MVSIIIPTFNRSKELLENLSRIGLLCEDRIKYEIIVIDNGSTDNTAMIVEKFMNNRADIQLKYFFDSEPGLLTGRHRGYQESSGSILAFIDDDILITESWLTFLNDLHTNNLNFDFFTGPNLPMYGSYPPDWLQFFWNKNGIGETCVWLSLMDFGGQAKEIPLVYVWGLNFIVRREAFVRTGGFHPDNIPSKFQKFQGDGETGLAFKAKAWNLTALYSPQLLVYHQVGQERLTKAYFGRRAYYQGVADSYTQLRKQHMINDSRNSSNNKTKGESNPKNWKGQLVEQFPFLISIVKLIKRRTNQNNKKSELQLNPEFIDILDYTKEQYKLGFEFHQNAFNTNAIVKEWVTRENYWEYKLPITND